MKNIARRWERNEEPPIVTAEENRKLKLPPHQVVSTWLQMLINIANDPEMGFSLIAGKGKKYQYVSNGDRAGVLPIMKRGLFG